MKSYTDKHVDNFVTYGFLEQVPGLIEKNEEGVNILVSPEKIPDDVYGCQLFIRDFGGWEKLPRWLFYCGNKPALNEVLSGIQLFIKSIAEAGELDDFINDINDIRSGKNKRPVVVRSFTVAVPGVQIIKP